MRDWEQIDQMLYKQFYYYEILLQRTRVENDQVIN
jgi:hypothetical protein